MTHIDDWVYNHHNPSYPRWMFLHFRLPSHLQFLAKEFIQSKLFCKYKGKTYRVTGASRFGDVWVTEDYEEDTKYQLRVDVDECSDWSDHV